MSHLLTAGVLQQARNQQKQEFALKLDGIDDFVEINVPLNSLNINGGTQVSVFCWAKSTKINSYQTLFNFGDASDSAGVMLRKSNLNKYVAYLNLDGDSDNNFIQDEDFSLEYVHFGFIYDGSIWKVYENGINISQRARMATIIGNKEKITFGNWLAASQWFEGQMYDVRLYSKALSESEINNVMNGINITDSLEGHWKLDGDANDYSGNGNHGTVNGATFVTL
jgi:hypothetical protein